MDKPRTFRFYTAPGLQKARRHLAADGILAVWSGAESICKYLTTQILASANKTSAMLDGGWRETWRVHRLGPMSRCRLGRLSWRAKYCRWKRSSSLSPGVVAIVSEQGGTSSHTAIVARFLRITAIAGITDGTSQVQLGMRLLVDRETGSLDVDP